ncbi:hypothetical protein [Allorhodopirellula heiligendammensis]|uniref:Uncharacterized protein n=1 Tax=Allorhodopirellula heiligendammensis TaxID=2714739 RepID=A0A5C6C3W6_9BACT|nr:hypothetical protein [Allorhodopirellula heiligendammensis]TWU19213.1 hypothetical protein Poly21_13840 [Allorhodopirellula heiligendammensis]
MKPLRITLVGNQNGARRIQWGGLLATAGVLAAICSPIAVASAMLMGSPPVLMIGAGLAVMLGTMVRIGLTTSLDELPTVD